MNDNVLSPIMYWNDRLLNDSPKIIAVDIEASQFWVLIRVDTNYNIPVARKRRVTESLSSGLMVALITVSFLLIIGQTIIQIN